MAVANLGSFKFISRMTDSARKPDGFRYFHAIVREVRDETKPTDVVVLEG
jgi:hypothetical protein